MTNKKPNTPAQPFSLNGHVALVTGSTRGLGKAIAITLGRAGAKVVLNYYNDQDVAKKAFDDFKNAGCQGIIVRADVTDETQVNDMVKQIEDQFGPVDILIPNATCAQPFKPFEEYSWDFFQTMVDFFIKSPYLLTRATIANMKKNKWGRIINITSEVFRKSVPNFSAYVAAKGGQIGFSRSLASELAPFGITVNCIAPGWIPVERHEKDPQELKDAYFATIPQKRWGVPQDVADAIRYFAANEASFITGQTLHVNGGNVHTL